MSDTRRRRKQSGGSDDLSDSYDELNAKDSQSIDQSVVRHDSEYDSAVSGAESDDGSQDGGERESGDGQEEDKPPKKLDDDEDRRNPQYIPKRGTFYEHDDRTAEETGESAVEPPPERETKEKKVWKDKEDRWNHDRYVDDEQAPKSHDELVAVYGYDIRNEEGPPRARRRRRYGRGPNKYTRNWEDEDAYGKTAASVTSGKTPGPRRTNRSGEAFPALGGGNQTGSTDSVDEPVISSAWYSNKNKTQINKQQNFPPLQPQQDNHNPKSGSSNTTHTNENRAPNEPTNPAWKREPKPIVARNVSPYRNVVGGVEPDKLISPRDPREPRKQRQVQESVSLAASKVRGRGLKNTNRTLDVKPKGRGPGLISVDPRNRINPGQHEDQQQELVNDTKHLTLNDDTYCPRITKEFYAPLRLPNTVPSHMQQQQPQPLPQQQQQPPHQQVHPSQQVQSDVSGNRPKRYSSLRQRPVIPEGPQGPPQPQPAYPPQHPQHGFYPPQAGNSHGVLESQGFPQNHFEPSAPVGNSAPPMPGQPVIPLAPGGQPAGYAAPFMVPPPQFISPQAAPPNIINYVPTPAGPAFQPNYQGYQGYNPTVQAQGPPPPPELFQPQGCTYYSPAQQPQQQQSAPIRRPKAAIPILPPPDHSNGQQYHQTSRGRGRTTQYNAPPVMMGTVTMTSPPQTQDLYTRPPPNAYIETIPQSGPEIFNDAQFEPQQPLHGQHTSRQAMMQQVEQQQSQEKPPTLTEVEHSAYQEQPRQEEQLIQQEQPAHEEQALEIEQPPHVNHTILEQQTQQDKQLTPESQPPQQDQFIMQQQPPREALKPSPVEIMPVSTQKEQPALSQEEPTPPKFDHPASPQEKLLTPTQMELVPPQESPKPVQNTATELPLSTSSQDHLSNLTRETQLQEEQSSSIQEQQSALVPEKICEVTEAEVPEETILNAAKPDVRFPEVAETINIPAIPETVESEKLLSNVIHEPETSIDPPIVENNEVITSIPVAKTIKIEVKISETDLTKTENSNVVLEKSVVEEAAA